MLLLSGVKGKAGGGCKNGSEIFIWAHVPGPVSREQSRNGGNFCHSATDLGMAFERYWIALLPCSFLGTFLCPTNVQNIHNHVGLRTTALRRVNEIELGKSAAVFPRDHPKDCLHKPAAENVLLFVSDLVTNKCCAGSLFICQTGCRAFLLDALKARGS